MSPTNLGDLASNQPAPTGLVQIARGVGGSINYAPTPQYRYLSNGTGDVGSPIAISITPTRPGWWVVRAETIWAMADAAWYYFTWYVNITPSDADGWANDYNHGSQHSAQGWMESCIDTVYRLNAGVTYTATMMFGYLAAGTVTNYSGGNYTFIQGEFIGEGSL